MVSFCASAQLNVMVKVELIDNETVIPLHFHLADSVLYGSLTARMYYIENDTVAYFVQEVKGVDTLAVMALVGHSLVEVKNEKEECFNYQFYLTGDSQYLNGSYGKGCRTDRRIQFVEETIIRENVTVSKIKKL